MELQLKDKARFIKAGVFLRAGRLLLNLLREVEVSVSGKDKPTLEWAISDLHMGSAVLQIVPTVEGQWAESGGEVMALTLAGLRLLSETSARPDHFSNRALRVTEELARVTADTPTHVAFAEEKVPLSGMTSENAQALLTTSVREYGAIEGTLKMVTVAGNPRFNVYDSVTGMPVTCVFQPELLAKIAPLIGQRVSVSGTVSFTIDGYPKSIVRIVEVTPMPPDKDLPTSDDLRKAGVDLSGGLTLEAFLERRHRGWS